MAAWVDDVMTWFDANRRDLPWRREPRDPWSVLVSEVMLQQTPVSRVIPAYHAWLSRWPDAHSLRADPPGEADGAMVGGVEAGRSARSAPRAGPGP